MKLDFLNIPTISSEMREENEAFEEIMSGVNTKHQFQLPPGLNV